jgi:hypothetical protein
MHLNWTAILVKCQHKLQLNVKELTVSHVLRNEELGVAQSQPVAGYL